jgi:hypothetical protein
MTFRLHIYAFVLAATIGPAACSTAAPSSTTPAAPSNNGPAAPASAPATPDQQLQALIGAASCTEDTQCKTIGWGAKACGGPDRIVAYSTQNTDTATLEALAKKQAEPAGGGQQQFPSDCAYVVDPGAHCVAQRCVLRNS